MKRKLKKTGAAQRKMPVQKRHPERWIVLILLLYGGSVQAQSTLNAGGGSATIGGQTYGYSIGEMARIQTVSTATLIVTEGILQPLTSDEIGINDPLSLTGEIHVYPNPATDVLWIQPALESGGTLQCRLVDIQGRSMRQQTFVLKNGRERQQISVAGLAAGTYMLRLSLNRNGQQFFKTVKIQKLQ